MAFRTPRRKRPTSGVKRRDPIDDPHLNRAAGFGIMRGLPET
jgi:hypothetical protein